MTATERIEVHGRNAAELQPSNGQPLRIALIADQCGPFYMGGYETRLWEFARRLAMRGHVVHVYSSSENDLEVEGVAFRRIRPPVSYFRDDGFRDLAQNAAYALALLMRLKGERYDVVDANSIPWLHLPSAYLFARFRRARFVVSAHEAFSRAMPTYFEARGGRFSRIRAFAAQRFYRWSQGLADAMIATSPSCVEGLRAEGFRHNIAVVPSGETAIDPSTRSWSPDDEMSIVFTGRLVQMKRLHVLIGVARALGDPKVTILGDGPLLEEVRSAVKHAGLTRTQVLGRVDVSRKSAILREANVFVMPSYREGWSLSTIEAMAHGCVPVYAHRPERYETGIVTYTQDGVDAFAFDGTVEGLAATLRRLRGNPALRAIMQRAAWAKASQFDWDVMLDRVESVYRGGSPQW